MAIERCGPADEAELLEVLRQVASRESAWSLVVSDGVSERIFYFAIGGIRVIRSGPRKSASIGEMLREHGKLDEDGLQAVLGRCRVERRLFGEIAVDMGFLTTDDVEAAIRAKVEEEILDIFLWDGAEYRLIEGQPPKEFYAGRFHAASLSCHVPTFVQSMLQHVERWRGVVGRLPTGREIYRLEDDADISEFSPPQLQFLQRFTGDRLAKDVISDADLRRTPAWNIVLRAVGVGALRRVAGHAAQNVNREQVAREVEALEKALDGAVDPRIVRARLARACESAGEKSRAAGHWRSLADAYRRRNDLERALEAYRESVRLLPTDFGAREIILDIHRHHRDYGKLVADGRPLADLLVKHNLLNRAKLLLIQLVGVVPKDAALRRQLIMVLIGLGEHEAALHHLRELAAVLEARNAPDADLLDVYLRILAMDKRDSNARARIDDLTGVRAQRRSIRLTLAASAVALGLLAGAFAYESSARNELSAAYEVARVAVEADDYAGARSAIDEAVARRPYAWASRDARDQLAALETMAATAEERARRAAQALGDGRSPEELGALQRRRRVREAEAAALRSAADDMLADGKLDEAHQQLGLVLDEYSDTSAARDVRLPLRLAVLPADATVRLGDDLQGTGSVVIMYAPATGGRLRIDCMGFEPLELPLDDVLPVELDVSLSKAVVWEHASDAAFEAAPLVIDDTVYVAGRDRALRSLALADGTLQWTAHLGLYGDSAVQPVVTPQGLIVGTGGGEAVCVDPTDGSIRWREDVGSAVEEQPFGTRGDDGIVVMACADGRLAALSVRDGAPRWQRGPQTVAVATAPHPIDDSVFAFVSAGRGLGIAATGDGTLKVRPGTSVTLRGTPSSELGRVWVMARDGTLRMVSAATGKTLKTFPVPMGSGHAPCVVGDVAFVTCTDKSVIALRADGQRVFDSHLPESAGASPAYAEGRLYVPALDGRLYVLDASTGAVLWRFDAGTPLRATPTLTDELILVATSGGRIVALQR